MDDEGRNEDDGDGGHSERQRKYKEDLPSEVTTCGKVEMVDCAVSAAFGSCASLAESSDGLKRVRKGQFVTYSDRLKYIESLKGVKSKERKQLFEERTGLRYRSFRKWVREKEFYEVAVKLGYGDLKSAQKSKKKEITEVMKDAYCKNSAESDDSVCNEVVIDDELSLPLDENGSEDEGDGCIANEAQGPPLVPVDNKEYGSLDGNVVQNDGGILGASLDKNVAVETVCDADLGMNVGFLGDVDCHITNEMEDLLVGNIDGVAHFVHGCSPVNLAQVNSEEIEELVKEAEGNKNANFVGEFERKEDIADQLMKGKRTISESVEKESGYTSAGLSQVSTPESIIAKYSSLAEDSGRMALTSYGSGVEDVFVNDNWEGNGNDVVTTLSKMELELINSGFLEFAQSDSPELSKVQPESSCWNNCANCDNFDVVPMQAIAPANNESPLLSFASEQFPCVPELQRLGRGRGRLGNTYRELYLSRVGVVGDMTCDRKFVSLKDVGCESKPAVEVSKVKIGQDIVGEVDGGDVGCEPETLEAACMVVLGRNKVEGAFVKVRNLVEDAMDMSKSDAGEVEAEVQTVMQSTMEELQSYNGKSNDDVGRKSRVKFCDEKEIEKEPIGKGKRKENDEVEMLLVNQVVGDGCKKDIEFGDDKREVSAKSLSGKEGGDDSLDMEMASSERKKASRSERDNRNRWGKESCSKSSYTENEATSPVSFETQPSSKSPTFSLSTFLERVQPSNEMTHFKRMFPRSPIPIPRFIEFEWVSPDSTRNTEVTQPSQLPPLMPVLSSDSKVDTGQSVEMSDVVKLPEKQSLPSLELNLCHDAISAEQQSMVSNVVRTEKESSLDKLDSKKSWSEGNESGQFSDNDDMSDTKECVEHSKHKVIRDGKECLISYCKECGVERSRVVARKLDFLEGVRVQKNADVVTLVVEKLLKSSLWRSNDKEEGQKLKAKEKPKARKMSNKSQSFALSSHNDENLKIILLDMNYGPNGGMIDSKLKNNKSVTVIKCDEFCNRDRHLEFDEVLSYQSAAAMIATMSSPKNPVYPHVVVIDPPYARRGGGHSVLTCEMRTCWPLIEYAYNYGLGSHPLKEEQFQSFYDKELTHVLKKGLVRPNDGIVLIKCQMNGRMNLPLMIRNLARSICINGIELDEVGQKSFPTAGLASDKDFSFVDINPDIKKSLMLVFRTRFVGKERKESVWHNGVDFVEAHQTLSEAYETVAAQSFKGDMESYFTNRRKWVDWVRKLFCLVTEKQQLMDAIGHLDLDYIATVKDGVLIFPSFGPSSMLEIEQLNSTKLQVCAMIAGETAIGLKNLAGLMVHLICVEYNITTYSGIRQKLMEVGIKEGFYRKYLFSDEGVPDACKLLRLGRNIEFLMEKIEEKRKTNKQMMVSTMKYFDQKVGLIGYAC